MKRVLRDGARRGRGNKGTEGWVTTHKRKARGMGHNVKGERGN